MSCQTYLTRGERRTRGSNENRNVCFVAMGVVDHEIYMRRLIASEDAVRWFWFSWTEPPRKRSPTHSVAALWNEFMMEMFKDDMRSYRTEYGL